MLATEEANMLSDLREQTRLLREIRDALKLLTQGKYEVITPAMSMAKSK
jgi:hypothetical protein